MEAKRIDEYHRSGSHFYGKLVVVHWLEAAQKDPNWGKFSSGISLNYLDKAKALVKEKYGDVTVLLDVPDLVVRIA